MNRVVKLVVGVVLLLAGVLFTLQGLNVMTGASMSGQGLWVFLGLLIALVGLYLVVSNLRTSPAHEE